MSINTFFACLFTLTVSGETMAGDLQTEMAFKVVEKTGEIGSEVIMLPIFNRSRSQKGQYMNIWNGTLPHYRC
ncbi:MAG: hypothetical protein GX654_12650 [Desulfatiglans sp.]|nr:hypothetical protein [Desulfatiglans sp.]